MIAQPVIPPVDDDMLPALVAVCRESALPIPRASGYQNPERAYLFAGIFSVAI